LDTDAIEESTYWNIRTGDEIKKVMAEYGITKNTTVIIYGDDSQTSDSGAFRVAFACLWAGVENVKVLDGGLNAWTKAGYATKTGIETPKATTENFGVTMRMEPLFHLLKLLQCGKNRELQKITKLHSTAVPAGEQRFHF